MGIELLWRRSVCLLASSALLFQLVAPGYAAGTGTGAGWLDESDWNRDGQSRPKPPLSAKPASGKSGSKPSRPSGTRTTRAEAAMWIGSKGGTLRTRSATLVIPAGALRRAVEIRVAEVAAPVDLDAPAADFVSGPFISLEPAGTRFNRPVSLRIQLPEAVLSGYRRGEDLRAWLLSGNQAIPVEDFRVDRQGRLVVEVEHFSGMLYGLVGLTLFMLFAAALGRMTATRNPHIMLTPHGRHTRNFALSGGGVNTRNVRLPARMKPSGATELFVNKQLNLTNSSFKNINSGETLLGPRGPNRANCADLTTIAASIMLAQPDPRFHEVIGVWGRYPDSKTDNKRERQRGANHMWLEAKIDGKVYLLDTTKLRPSAGGSALLFYPKEELTQRYRLIPMQQFGYRKASSRYVGLKPDQETDTTAAYNHGFDLGCRHAKFDEHADKDGIRNRYNRQDPALGQAFMRGWTAGNAAPQCQR